jgi:hypothetical protein
VPYRIDAERELGVVAELHATGPLDSEPVVVTSEAALRAVLDGTSAPARATELGVLINVLPT